MPLFQHCPKNTELDNQCPHTFLAPKELFKINSEIRDLDIIYEKLQKYPPNDNSNKIIDTLKETRVTKLEYAKNIALALNNTDASKLLNQIKVTQKELEKRYNKIY